MGAQIATFRAGSGTPLVLTHVGANPWHKWGDALDLLVDRHDVFVPTLICFDGGPDFTDPVRIEQIVDRVEDALDAAGIDKAHFAGNSLGGWISMEMARRGRALSAVAISPAGGWPTKRQQRRCWRFFMWNARLRFIANPIAPLAMRFGFMRRILFRFVATHGERLTRDQALAMSNDTLAGNLPAMLGILDEVVQTYPDPGVPTLLAWAEKDRLLPIGEDGQFWRQATPYAEWRVMPGVGHVPMCDEPAAVAEMILDWVAAAEAAQAEAAGA